MKSLLLRTLLPALMALTASLSAQTYSLNGIGRYNMRNSGTIVEDNVIKGYYFFYESEKVDKKNRAFEIVVLDENLTEKVSETIIEPKTTHLLEAAYNGTSILFKFFNAKTDEVSYRTIDNSGKLSAKESRPANKLEITSYNNAIAKDMTNVNLNPFGHEQFVDIHTFKDDKGYSYQVKALDNDGTVKWTYEPDHEKGVDAADYLAANAEKLVLLGSNAKNIMSRDYSFKLVVLNSEGQLDYEIPLENKKYNMMAHNAYFEPETGNLVVIGEYYNIDDKAMKAESKGIFAKVIDKEGNDVSEHFISWDKDIYNKVNAENKKDISKYSIFFHNIIRTSDGKILAVGEQYRKQVSAGGVALKALATAAGGSTDASSLEIKIGKMIVIELSKEFALNEVKIIDKKPNKIILSQDYSLVNQHVLAKILKLDGAFDYTFTQNDKTNSIVSIGYIDLERIEGKGKRKAVFNTINYVAADGAYSSDKLALETDASYLNVQPAKPGHVIVVEYFRKTKTISVRLEPINL